MKEKIYQILEGAPEAGKKGKFFLIFIISLILLNVLFVILETVDTIENKYREVFYLFEVVSVIIFSIEYLLRLWSCTSIPKYSKPILGRIKFGITFLSIIDLLAILPFYIPFLITVDLRVLRLFRIFRFLRILKVGRYSESLRIFSAVFKAKKGELFVCLFITIILLILTSSFMYFIEHDAQPEVFSSIPETMWWGVATLTTVGYGDIYPITPLGKIIGSIISILGIGLFALPTGILASGFAEEMRKKKLIEK